MTHRSVETAPRQPASGADAANYQRTRDLPRLLPLWPHEVEPESQAEHARLLARIRRALRMERQRGVAGHWAYDLARHVALLRAYRAEVDALVIGRDGKGARRGD